MTTNEKEQVRYLATHFAARSERQDRVNAIDCLRSAQNFIRSLNKLLDSHYPESKAQAKGVDLPQLEVVPKRRGRPPAATEST